MSKKDNPKPTPNPSGKATNIPGNNKGEVRGQVPTMRNPPPPPPKKKDQAGLADFSFLGHQIQTDNVNKHADH